jgi:hypothetical protein
LFDLSRFSFFPLFVYPSQSAIDTDKIIIDKETQDMLKALDFASLANVEVGQAAAPEQRRRAQQA